ncbi:MAG: hypothetical protein HFH82_03250 [Lachnospiraceae bacterium]|nr:hypothetical protein [Lachnospiraceae bacterium]
MRKNRLQLKMMAVFCVFAFTGCQKVPDGVEGNGIMHAQGDLERQVQDIAGADAQERAAGQYQGTVGTGDNKININAEIPPIPDNMYIITLKPDDGLDMDALRAFLDSESGVIEDTSQALCNEIEENDRQNNTVNEYNERFLYTKFGDHSGLRLSDGTKEASFAYHTTASYVDNELREKCLEVYDKDTETLITWDKMEEGSFSANKAGEILLDKVKAVGVSELAFKNIYYIEGSDYSFYHMEFVPVYDGIEVGIGSDSVSLGQVWPNGYASVTQDGVAELNLIDFCGKAADKESVTAISFAQVLKILAQYLDSGMIESDGKIIYDRVELNYYPVPNPTPSEIEYKSQLVLMPMWHIYIPIDEYVNGGYDNAVGRSHICVNAVTGELIETD